MMSDNDVR